MLFYWLRPEILTTKLGLLSKEGKNQFRIIQYRKGNVQLHRCTQRSVLSILRVVLFQLAIDFCSMKAA